MKTEELNRRISTIDVQLESARKKYEIDKIPYDTDWYTNALWAKSKLQQQLNTKKKKVQFLLEELHYTEYDLQNYIDSLQSQYPDIQFISHNISNLPGYDSPVLTILYEIIDDKDTK